MDDFKVLTNMLSIAREGNIAKAASKLYITQSALNQQLLGLEKELGVPIFERHYHTLVPTVPGRIYLRMAQEILDCRNNAYKKIRENANEEIGEISLGLTPEKGMETFSRVYPRFHQKYPRYTFKLVEDRTPALMKALLRHDCEFAMVSRTEETRYPDNVQFQDLALEYIVLGVPKDHPLARFAGERSHETLPAIDLRLLEKENFVMNSRTTYIRHMLDQLFEQNHFEPKILFESASTATIIRMIISHMGLGFFPQSYVNPSLPLVYFRTKPALSWMRDIAYLKGTYMSGPEKDLFQMYLQELIRGEE